MSFIEKCDICGKHAKQRGVKFDNHPLRIQIPNHKGENYNFYLTLQLEDAEDTKKIKEVQKKIAEQQMLDQLFPESDCDCSSMGGGNVPMETIEIQFKNPYPMICEKCKREIIKLILGYGSQKNVAPFSKHFEYHKSSL